MDDLLEILEKFHKQTGGHCGQTLTALKRKTGYTENQLKKFLKALYKSGKIQVRDGAQGKLIMLNK